MTTHRRSRWFVLAVAVLLSGLIAGGCGSSPDEASARSAVEDMKDGEFLRSGSVNRFGIDSVTVAGECAVVHIIELPNTYEVSIFLRWNDGGWEGTNIVTGHGSIDPDAADCFRP
jgi:hypothetical protein